MSRACSAHNEALVSSLRTALRDVYERYKAYKERSAALEAEAAKKLGDYAAETAGKLREWGSDPTVNGTHVEAQLQVRNAQYKHIENREVDRQTSNRASFEADLASILEDIVKRDACILEVRVELLCGLGVLVANSRRIAKRCRRGGRRRWARYRHRGCHVR